MGFRGIIAYSSLALFWAAFFVSLRVSVVELGVGLTVGVFGLVGAVALAALSVAVGRKLAWRLSWGEVLGGAGLALVILSTTVYAISQLGAGLAAVIISAIPLAATVVGQMRGEERVTGLGAISLVLGIVGLMLVSSFASGAPSWAFISGVQSALIAAVAAGAFGSAIVTRLRSAHSLETTIVAAGIVGVAGLVVAPFTPAVHPSNGWDLILVAAVAAICAFLVLFALSSASDGVPRRTAATLPGVGTLLALIAAVVILHEQVSAVQVLGMLLILAGTGLLRGLVPHWFPASWRA
jgi:drug/metabolite transporter (DMT)-like permease